MNKVMSILGVATKIMSFLVVTVIAVISLATAYIMFAPDEFPKPFRLMYSYDTASHESEDPHVIVATSTPEPPKPGEGTMFNMSTKIINLADPTGRKYIRLTVVLEFKTEEEEEVAEAPSSGGGHGAAAPAVTAAPTFEEKVNALMPIMDDVVIKLLSTKTFEDLYTAEGKEMLRGELMNAIQESVPQYHLISVYFTEFVVQ